MFLSTTCFSQNKNEPSWYGELHVGWQATLNALPYSVQLKDGENTNRSIHQTLCVIF